MLTQIFHDPIPLALAQSVAVILLALATILLARSQAISIANETVVGIVRAILQIVAIGSVLAFLLSGPEWTSIILLSLMIVAAAFTARKRARDIPDAFLISLYGIGIGSGSLIILMVWIGVIDSAISDVVPVGSMLIAGAMNSNAMALDRFQADIKAHVGEIEAALALGAKPKTVIERFTQNAVYASLIPRLDNLRSLGIVWIPGLMAGMIVSGEDPIYAALYQFVVMVLVFVVAAFSSIITSFFVRGRIFSPAEQLLLRPKNQPPAQATAKERKNK